MHPPISNSTIDLDHLLLLGCSITLPLRLLLTVQFYLYHRLLLCVFVYFLIFLNQSHYVLIKLIFPQFSFMLWTLYVFPIILPLFPAHWTDAMFAFRFGHQLNKEIIYNVLSGNFFMVMNFFLMLIKIARGIARVDARDNERWGEVEMV